MLRMKNIKLNQGWVCFLIKFLPLVFLFHVSCYQEKTGETVSPSMDMSKVEEAMEKWEIIGEGTDFLTVKIDLAKKLPSKFQIFGLALDEDGYPMRKLSGYTHNPQLKGKNHLWFYFFLYAPREWPDFLKESEYLKFIVVKEEQTVYEKVVTYQKSWGINGKPKIFDRPAPPDEIPGNLVLKDYTFLANGDFRAPQGYHVEGKIIGGNGRWDRFIVFSDIRGEEAQPEVVLPTDQGWLELETGRTHSMQEAISPSPPYVNGWWDGKGYFHPDPVKIFGLIK